MALNNQDTLDIKKPRTRTQPTKGRGDCALHALFGEWNGKEFKCLDIIALRKQIAETIKSKIKSDEALFVLLKEAIKAIIMEGRRANGKKIAEIQKEYKNYQECIEPIVMQQAWNAFEKKINESKEVVTYVEGFIKNYSNYYGQKNPGKKLSENTVKTLSSSFKRRFFTCLWEDDGTLRCFLLSIATLENAFKEYNEQSSEKFSWDNILTDQTIIDEYIEFIGVAQEWLLPLELQIIASVTNTKVHYYVKNNTSGNDPVLLAIYNPEGKKTVEICFNGINHYERMVLDELIEIQSLLDKLYPESDARLDQEIRKFRENTLKELERLRIKIINFEEERELKKFIKKLKIVQRLEATPVKEQEISVLPKVINVNSYNQVQEKAIQITGAVTVIFNVSSDANRPNQVELAAAKENLKRQYQSQDWNQIPLLRHGSQKNLSLSLDDWIDLNLIKVKQPQIGQPLKDTVVHLKELFSPHQKKILLLGEMGSGKSLFTRFLAYQWAKGNLMQDFDYVFHMDLLECMRSLSNVKNLTCDELLQLIYTNAPIERGNVIKSLLRGKKVLLLVDRYNEVASRNPNIIKSIIDQTDYYCLITSRPEMSQKLENKVDLIITNHGISAASIPVYIKTYFNMLALTQQGENLYTWLQQQPALLGICLTPIYLEMLCQLWKSDPESIKSNKDLSKVELHKTFVDGLLEEHMVLKNKTEDALRGTPRGELPEVILSHMFLEQVAYLSFQQEEQKQLITDALLQKAVDIVKDHISEEKINAYLPVKKGIATILFNELKRLIEEERKIELPSFHVSFFEGALASGILKVVTKGGKDQDTIYSFPRASFAEYFMACYVCHHLDSDAFVIAEHKYNHTWQLVWKMAAGMLKEDPKRLNQFFEILLSPPRDLYGKYEVVLLMQCLNACGWSKHLKPSYREAFRNYLTAWLNASLPRGDVDFLIPSIISQPIDLETLLKNAYRQAGDKPTSLIFFSRKRKEQEIQKLAVRYAAIKVLSAMDELSDDGVSLLFDAWKSKVGLLYSAAESGIKRFANLNVKVIEKLLNRDGPGEITPFVMEGWSMFHNKPAHEEMLVGISNPNEKVIDYLLQKLKKVDDNARIQILTVLGKIQTPSKEMLLFLLEIMDEWAKLYQKDVQGHELASGKNIIFYLAAYKVLLTWGAKHLYDQLDILPIKQLISNLLRIASSGKMAFFDYPLVTDDLLSKFFNDLYQRQKEFSILLLEFINDKDRKIRGSALSALGCVQNPSLNILKILLDVCIDRKERNWEKAFKALLNLVSINGARLIEPLNDLLHYKEETREIVILLLAKLSNYNSEAIKELVKVSSYKDHKDFILLYEARETLAGLDSLDQESTKLLLSFYKDAKTNIETRIAILQALGRSSCEEDEILNVLFEVIKEKSIEKIIILEEPKSFFPKSSPEIDIVKAAEKAMLKRTYSATGVKLLLEQAKPSKNITVRKIALRALGKIPSPDKEVTEVLLNSSIDEDIGIQQIALKAVENDFWSYIQKGDSSIIYVGHLRDRLWSPTPKALKFLRKSAKHASDIKVRTTALRSLARVENIDVKVLIALFKCYSDENKEINDAAKKILLHFYSERFSMFSKTIEKYLLDNYEKKSMQDKRIFLKLFGIIPNPSSQTIKLLLDECGHVQEDIFLIARTSLVQLLTDRSDAVLNYCYEDMTIKDILKGGVLTNYEKPLGPLAQFDPVLLQIMLEGCGHENQRIRWVSTKIINNFSNYDHADVEMLEEKAKSINSGTQIAALKILTRMKMQHEQSQEKLVSIGLNNDEKNDVRIFAFKALSHLSNQDEKQTKALLKFFLQKNEDPKIFLAAWEALSLQSLLTCYPANEIDKIHRQRWLDYKLSSPLSAIVENSDGSFSLFIDSKPIIVKPVYGDKIKHDLSKVRLVPLLQIPEMPLVEIKQQTHPETEKEKITLPTASTHSCLMM